MLKPGDTAPPFDLPCAVDDRVGRLRLSQIDSQMAVLFFYPHDFSFICPLFTLFRNTSNTMAEMQIA